MLQVYLYLISIYLYIYISIYLYIYIFRDTLDSFNSSIIWYGRHSIHRYSIRICQVRLEPWPRQPGLFQHLQRWLAETGRLHLHRRSCWGWLRMAEDGWGLRFCCWDGYRMIEMETLVSKSKSQRITTWGNSPNVPECPFAVYRWFRRASSEFYHPSIWKLDLGGEPRYSTQHCWHCAQTVCEVFNMWLSYVRGHCIASSEKCVLNSWRFVWYLLMSFLTCFIFTKLTANLWQDSDNVVVFRRDRRSGKLEDSGQRAKMKTARWEPGPPNSHWGCRWSIGFWGALPYFG